MATTSGNQTAGKVLAAGQGKGGKDSNKERAAVAMATAVLGLSLVVGGILGHGRPAERPVASQVSTSASAGARPVDASMTGAYRWDFGQVRPADASVTAEYRWDVGAALPALDWEQQERTQVAPPPVQPAIGGTLEYLPGEEPTLGTATPTSAVAERFWEHNTDVPASSEVRPQSGPR
jgi:hypothetical protein